MSVVYFNEVNGNINLAVAVNWIKGIIDVHNAHATNTWIAVKMCKKKNSKVELENLMGSTNWIVISMGLNGDLGRIRQIAANNMGK